jgi:hypothetical protein
MGVGAPAEIVSNKNDTSSKKGCQRHRMARKTKKCENGLWSTVSIPTTVNYTTIEFQTHHLNEGKDSHVESVSQIRRGALLLFVDERKRGHVR